MLNELISGSLVELWLFYAGLIGTAGRTEFSLGGAWPAQEEGYYKSSIRREKKGCATRITVHVSFAC